MSLRTYLSPGPTAVWSFRYEREDGEFRSIDIGVGYGRFARGTMEEAREIAERRLDEQFGDMCLLLEEQRKQVEPTVVDLGADRLRNRPDLHHQHYSFVSATRVR